MSVYLYRHIYAQLGHKKHRLTLKTYERGGVQLEKEDIPVHHAAFQEQSVVSYLIILMCTSI